MEPFNFNGFVCAARFPICTNQANKSQESSAKPSSAQSKSAVDSEFVSDAFQTTDKDLDEVKAGMKLLGIDSLANQSNKNDGKTRRWKKKLKRKRELKSKKCGESTIFVLVHSVTLLLFFFR